MRTENPGILESDLVLKSLFSLQIGEFWLLNETQNAWNSIPNLESVHPINLIVIFDHRN